MIDEKLMEIYYNSKSNKGKPECVFSETIIFNEGWLLRGVLEKWRGWKKQTDFQFLPFPDDVKTFSEGELYTPFKRIKQISGKYAEGKTKVDGIVGNFSIAKDVNGEKYTKSGIELDKDFKYLAVFEAKMYSKLDTKTTNVKNYNQVSRTVACIINSVIKTKKSRNYRIYYIVVYPKDNKKITPDKFTKNNFEFIEREIEDRLAEYKKKVSADSADNRFDEFFQFEKKWKHVLKNNFDINFVTWEKILGDLGEKDSINEFYKLCEEFNK